MTILTFVNVPIVKQPPKGHFTQVLPASRGSPFIGARELYFVVPTDPASILSRRHGMVVYRGMLVAMDSFSMEQERSAICKIASRHDATIRLRVEADLYHGRLQGLQGDVVPLFHGLFQGDTPQNTPCILIDDEGDALGGDEWVDLVIPDLSREMTKDLLGHLIKIHHTAVCHNDFRPKNVVMKGNKLTIIDFDIAKPHNFCDFDKNGTVELLHIGELVPEGKDRAFCEEIFKVCRVLGVWVPRHVPFHNWHVPYECLKSFQDFDKYMRKRFRITVSDKPNMLQEAEEFVRDFQIAYKEDLVSLGWEIEDE